MTRAGAAPPHQRDPPAAHLPSVGACSDRARPLRPARGVTSGDAGRAPRDHAVSAAELEYLAYSARHYVELAAAYRRQGG